LKNEKVDVFGSQCSYVCCGLTAVHLQNANAKFHKVV